MDHHLFLPHQPKDIEQKVSIDSVSLSYVLLFYLLVIPEVAYRVMSECTSGIRRCGIDLHFLAEKLLEKKIINNRQKKKATDEHSGRTTDQRMDQLLDIIKDSVQQEGKVFEYILEILKDEDTILANKLYDDMINKYEQYK